MKQGKQKLSITALLVSTVGILVGLSVSVVLGLSFMANLKNTTELLEQSSDLLISQIEQQIANQINPTRYVVDHIVDLAVKDQLDFNDKSELVPTLKAVMAAAPDLTGVAVWLPDGAKVQIHREPGDNSMVISTFNNNESVTEEFLKQLKAAKGAVWDEPFRLDGISFISVSAPIYRDGVYLGAVSAAISIANLSTAIKEMGKGTGFTGYILYNDKQVLAHKNLPSLSSAKLSPSTPLHHVRDIGDVVLANLDNGFEGTLLNSKNFDTHIVRLEDTNHVVISRSTELYGKYRWQIGVHVPQGLVSTQLKRIMVSMMAGLALLGLSIVATILLAKRIARPIKSISLAATSISTLDLDKIDSLPASRIREIDNQARAFNQMLDGLKWFESYVPRKLVGRLIKQQDDQAAISRQENLTVMFTDLTGFTKMSEKLSPADTAKMLNEHFEIINKCIEKTDGTLDKYIGDAVMAFWGAPDTQQDHALRACETACCIAERLEQEKTGLRVKIALHSGPLIVGNIGARGRMNYTVIGDTVNTCSRIEKLAGDLMKKATDDDSMAYILLSDQVAQAIGDKFIVEPAGEFSVKGRENMVIVYRLMGRKTDTL